MVDVNVCNDHKSTPVLVAAQNGQVQAVQILINQFQCTVHTRDCNGRTMLHYACEWGHSDLIHKLLADSQLDQRVKDKDGNTAFQLAVINGHVEATRLLVQQHVTGKMDINTSILGLAALHGHGSIVNLLLQEFNWDPTTVYYEGKSILHCACIGGDADLLSELISKYRVGTVMAAVDDDGNTPLHVSTMHKNTECVSSTTP